ncbi:dynein heavy chain domain-containing protein 1 [Chanos chanos]|uniref:Dynein heavy chain domain-containing protein 1 n=1 Tax=Chanos chanos TaxID=29144 RepID=A0A6J2VPB1_CHACN|nr:dynein heavy chain domain-containing protein 1 [Chanos chanos]
MSTTKKNANLRVHTRETLNGNTPAGCGNKKDNVSLPTLPSRGLQSGVLSPHLARLSVVELPRLVAAVGTEISIGDSIAIEGPCLMASVLGADIPIKATDSPQMDIVTDDAPSERPKEQHEKTKTRKESKHKSEPLTGFEVVEIFAKKRHLGELEFYYLKVVEDVPYRPYDLRVVPRSKAGLDHYIFSPASVTHVQGGCSAEIVTLARWHQEAILWRALRDIPFFRDYLLRKSLKRWYRNLRLGNLQRISDTLQAQLLMSVPHFREALFHIAGLIEELKKVCWLPRDVSKTYTLLDFQTVLKRKNQEAQGILEKFLQCCTLTLNMVKEESYGAYQELQLRIERSKISPHNQPMHLQHSQPMHLQRVQLRELQRELGQAERVIQRLGNMAALVNHMIVQCILSIFQQEVNFFVKDVLKGGHPEQVSLFQAELVFGTDGQLTLFPPIHLFQEVLLGAVASVADSVLQVFDSCKNSPDFKDYMSASASFIRDIQALTTSTTAELKDGELTAVASLPSKKKACVMPISTSVLPMINPLSVQGEKLRGHYYPLSRGQLERQLSLNAWAHEAQWVESTVLQGATEVRQLCEGHSWLVDIHVFTSEWSHASLEDMRGWSSFKYEEHIKRVRSCTDKVHTVPSFFTTSNKLFTIHCSHIQERIGFLLKSIDEDVLKMLSEELQLRSDALVSELKRAVKGLMSEPNNFNDFTNYASMVLDLWDQFTALLKRAVETVSHSLPSVVNNLDSAFSSLAKELEGLVSTATTGPYVDPSQNAAQLLNNLSSTCRQMYRIASQLNELSKTSKNLRGHPLDLTFVVEAKRSIEARKDLWELRRVSTAQIQEWRLLLFSKFPVASAQDKVNEWLQKATSLTRTIPSRDAVLEETAQTLEEVKQQLSVLAKLSSPTLKRKHWINIFKGIGLLYSPAWNLTVADLMSKNVWKHNGIISKICQDSKAETDMEQVFQKLQRFWEVASFRLAKFIITVWPKESLELGEEHQKKPGNPYLSAQNSAKQYSYDSGTFTIIGLEAVLAQTEDSIMTLSNMLLSPHVADFREEVEHWIQLLQELEELLDFCERYQQKWVFLSKMFYEITDCTQKEELLEMFSPVDKIFREIIQITLHDPHVLNIVQVKKTTEANSQFQGQRLRILFIEGLTTMEGISNQLLCLLDLPREQFKRLYFLSNDEVIKLLSLQPTPSSILPFVRKCFKGVRWLEVDQNSDKLHENDRADITNELGLSSNQLRVKGVYGTLGEHVPLLFPLEPNLSPLLWLGLLEQQLQKATKQLMSECVVARQCCDTLECDQENDKGAENLSPRAPHFSSFSVLINKEGVISKENEPPTLLDLISEFPLQCILVVEEVLWYTYVQKALLNRAHVKYTKAQNAAKIQNLCKAIRDLSTDSGHRAVASSRLVTSLRSLVLLVMKHAQQFVEISEVHGDLSSSFEWQKLMKYHLSLVNNSSHSGCSLSQEDHCKEQLICVDVFGAQLPYGYEYIGPENWMMVSTPSTERAVLGILLALTSYRSGFISGLRMSGKSKTAVHLGQALGRQVVTLTCCRNTSFSVVQQMLLGALQTGAWLVLDSVDSLSHGMLSLLGQDLSDIHQTLSVFQGNIQQKEIDDKPSSKSKDWDFITKDYKILDEDECPMLFAGKKIMAKLNYGCVMISSDGYSAEVPENLRVATRPVSLTQHDCRIVAEVMLLSHGFSEATTISQCLVSLFSLAKDLLCLLDSATDAQISWLVLLRNVITTSKLYLHSNNEERRESLSDTVLKSSEKEAGEVRSRQPRQFKCPNKSAAVVNAVLEEQAVIKGIMSVLLPAIFDQRRASEFCRILEEIFPAARSFPAVQQFIEEYEQNILKDAITEELQKTGFYCDTSLLHNTLNLYQALKLSRAVVLIGPAGSGKTTCYRALAGALRKLAASAAEAESEDALTTENDSSKRFSHFSWSSVETVVLFPNALSYEEFFGSYNEQQGSWWDGALTKVLRDSELYDFSVNSPAKIKKSILHGQKVKWLVLDGDPLSQPGWLDILCTFSILEEPFLCLSSGEKIFPSCEEFKILAEVTDLGNATPSAVTCCNLVYISGKDMWKAVWKAEKDSLYRELTLDQSTLKMWSYLADDLFSSTLTFLRQQTLASVMFYDEYEVNISSSRVTYGLQEIMSFVRIFRALLEQFGKAKGLKATLRPTEKRDETPDGSKQSCTDPIISSTQQELQNRNLFVLAYIWGFGGQLHPRHWPQFDHFAREALYKSRYKVEVPPEGTVFEYFFDFSDDQHFTANAISNTRNECPSLSYRSMPQYEKCACVLDLLLDAHQPALLVGESGSGKTTLCQSLLTQERPHIRLPASPLLQSADLRNILEKMGSQKTRMATTGTSIKQPGLLLFVDDLHEAPLDVCGKTCMALETLRQCISRGGVLTSNGCHFKLFSSGAISYLGTCSTSGVGSNNWLSPRLTRLFTILVLPVVTKDVLFSMHSARLYQWLREFPSLSRVADMAKCIITATLDLYHAVCEQFPRDSRRPHFVFSLHDIEKVFQGMYLWGPRMPFQRKVSVCPQTALSSSSLPFFSLATFGPAANVLNIARLWLHECLRTFGDRLSLDQERHNLVLILSQVCDNSFSSWVLPVLKTSGVNTPSPVRLSPVTTTGSVKVIQQQPPSQMHKDKNESILPTETLVRSPLPKEVGNLMGLVEETEFSEEQSSSEPNFHYSGNCVDSSSEASEEKSRNNGKNTKDDPNTDESHSVPLDNIATHAPGNFQPSPPKEAKTSKNPHLKRIQKLQWPPTETHTSEKTGGASPVELPLHLLQDMAYAIHNVIFCPELCEPLHSRAQQCSFKRNAVYQERDLDILVHQLALTVKRKEKEEEKELDNKDHNTTSCAVHKQRVKQLVHVLRALLIPGGHGVLFAAARNTGRKTTVRLAACLTRYKLFEVHPRNESKLWEMLKEAGSQVGVRGSSVVFLIHEETSQDIKDKLLFVMANGTFPGLYSDEELKNLALKINAVLKSHNRPSNDQALEKYFRDIKRNMHVFLLLPLIQDTSKRQPGEATLVANITKALSLSCYVEVYQPWNTETLTEIATCSLKKNLDDDLVASISHAMAGIHQSATEYATVFLNMQPFSPQTHEELMAHFFHLCSHLSEQGRDQANKIATVLARVKAMTDKVDQYSQEVLKLASKVAETEKCLEQVQSAVDAGRLSCECSRQHCLLEENRLAHLKEQSYLTQQHMQEASPLYQAAVKALQSLSQSDLDEVRRYRNPPARVVMVMDTLCRMFNRPPNWESSKQLLGQANFFQELEFYDVTQISDELFQKLGKIVEEPNFQPATVRGVSRACESLCRWVQAIYQYACVQRRMAPQRAQRSQLDELMAESRARLREARLQEEAAGEQLRNLEKQRQFISKELESLSALLHKAKTKEGYAVAAIQQLGCHIAKWKEAQRETEVNNQTISGDALILAAAITYLGPFRPDIRLELLGKWRKLCLTGGIDKRPRDPRSSLLSSPEPTPAECPLFVPIPMCEEPQVALARVVGLDERVAEGVPPWLILKLLLWGCRVPWATRWPLLSEIQQYEELSSRTPLLTGKDTSIHKEGEYGLLVCADDPELLDKLNQGAEKGLKVLVTHVERATPSDEFLELLVQPAGSCSPGRKHPIKVAHPDFCLSLSTPLPVQILQSEIHPSILAAVQLIDLSLSPTEVKDIILMELMQSECLALWKHHCQVRRNINTLQVKLNQAEVSLMEYILNSSTPLHEDPEFLPHVSAYESTSQMVESEILELSHELDQNTSLLNDYYSVAGLATALCQALQEVARLSPFYFFPLRNFLLVLQGALALKERSCETNSSKLVTDIVTAEITHRIVSHFLAQYQPCLFQSHAALLRLLVSLTFFAHTEVCSEVEHVTFLRGFTGMESPQDVKNSISPCLQSLPQLPSWIPPHARTDVHLLERITPFKGLVSSFMTSSKQWQEYFHFPSSTVVGSVPCQTHSHLSTLQRALLWKTLFPEWLSAVAEDLAACQQGHPIQSAVAGIPYPGSPEAISQLLHKNEGPVIVALPDSSKEGWESVHPFHWIEQVARYQADKEKIRVMVISFGAECQREAVLSALDTAVQNGCWLVLNNCHILDHWDDEVVHQLSQVISGTSEGPQANQEAEDGLVPIRGCTRRQVHPHFRLWFITKEHKPFSVPAVVRLHALRLVCSSPRDLREELCSAIRLVVSSAISADSPRPTVSSLEPLLRCGILHSVLMQRQAFKHLGQGNVYRWTQEDLITLLEVQAHVTKHCSDPAGALHYVAARLVYGGHVSDCADLEAVEAVSTACLRPEPELWGSGPHTLPEIINTFGPYDLDTVLSSLEHHVHALPSSSDTVVLGFSPGLSIEMVKLQSRTLNGLLDQSENTQSTGRVYDNVPHPPLVPLDTRGVKKRLQALKGRLESGEDKRGKEMGSVPSGPLHNFLQTEWNGLKEMVASFLVDLAKPPRYDNAIRSPDFIVSTLSQLETQVDLLTAYLWERKSSDQPAVYCLSAFLNPRGFLAAVRREAAQTKQRDIGQVYLHFQVLGAAVSPACLPASGVYICGLDVQGALWNTRLEALQDTLSPQPCPLPLVWVRGRVRNSDIATSPDSSTSTASLPVYHCPLYLDTQLGNVERCLSEEHIVTRVPLVTKLDPVLCTLRRVRLVSSLRDSSYMAKI